MEALNALEAFGQFGQFGHLDILDTFDTDPLVSPKCQSGQAQKSLKIGTIRDITLIASVKPIYSSLKKKYLKHRLYFSANRRDNFAVK